MKTADDALKLHLLTVTELEYCELYTLSLTNGLVLRHTDNDGDITVDGNTFVGTGGIVPSRGNTRLSVGVEVDEMEVEYSCDDTAVHAGLTLQAMAASGWLTKADILVQRLIFAPGGAMPSWDPIHIFEGEVAKPSAVTISNVGLDVQSFVRRLQRATPQTVIQPGCRLHVFDPTCALEREDFAVLCTAAEGSGSTYLLSDELAALAKPDGYYDKGMVLFTTGANAGLCSSVKHSTGSTGEVELCSPLLVLPAAGDAYKIYPGCDGQFTTCINKFDNRAHFLGFPFVPPPETAI